MHGREPRHRPHDALDGTVVRLDGVVEVFALPHLDVSLVLGVVAVDGRSVGAALVDRDLLGFAVLTDRALQKATRRRPISASREQKVHRVTIAINGTVQIFPFAADLDAGLVHGPTLANCTLAA